VVQQVRGGGVKVLWFELFGRDDERVHFEWSYVSIDFVDSNALLHVLSDRPSEPPADGSHPVRGTVLSISIETEELIILKASESRQILIKEEQQKKLLKKRRTAKRKNSRDEWLTTTVRSYASESVTADPSVAELRRSKRQRRARRITDL
jgi:hypothetical protein